MNYLSIQSTFARTQDKTGYGQPIVQALQSSIERLKTLTNICRVPSCTKVVKQTDLLCGSHLEAFCDDLTSRNANLNDPCGDCGKEHDVFDCFNGFNSPTL